MKRMREYHELIYITRPWYREPLNWVLIGICVISISGLAIFAHNELTTGGNPTLAPFQNTKPVKQ